MATDSATLYAQSACLQCYGLSEFQTLQLALLVQIALNDDPSNPSDAATLIGNGSCFDCFGALGLYRMMELSLLAEIGHAVGVSPQTLLTEAQCYLCNGISIGQAMELALLARIAPAPLVIVTERVTDLFEVRVTDAGDIRIID